MIRVISLGIFRSMLVWATFQAQSVWAYECDEVEAAQSEFSSAASDLDSAARQLANCASSEDYEDDCSSEMYRVQSSHSDYEDAASELESAKDEYDEDDEC